jgi:hypothetical protein
MTDSYNLLSPAYHRSCSSAWQHHCRRLVEDNGQPDRQTDGDRSLRSAKCGHWTDRF